MSTKPSITPLPEADIQALHRVISSLPYTGLTTDSPESVADVVEYLEAVAKLQRAAADRAYEAQQAHLALQRDLAAVRRVFGTTQA